MPMMTSVQVSAEKPWESKLARLDNMTVLQWMQVCIADRFLLLIVLWPLRITDSEQPSTSSM